MDIKVDQATMQGIVVKTIFDTLTQDDRDKLIAHAIAHIIEPSERPKRGGFGTEAGPSILEQAFQNAASAATHQMVHERMETDPAFKAAIDAIITDAVRRLSESPLKDAIAEKIAEQVIEGFRLRTY